MDSTDWVYDRAVRYNVPGHAHFLTFSCHQRLPLLSNEIWKQWMGECVRSACDKEHIALWAYVFMPEHVHLLVRPRREKYRISDFLYEVKKPMAERVLTASKENRSAILRKLQIEESGKQKYRFWLAGGGHDLNIYTMKKAIEKAQYCHRNPLKRRLVKSPEQWRWSSFRWLEMGRVEGEPLRLDPWDEALEES
jgi:putative transposase